MKTRNHLRRTLLLPALLLALLPPCACTDDICPDTAPLPGADSEATASLIGQPIQIGCIATSVEQQSPMAGEGGAQTRAELVRTDPGFPQPGTTMTVFMTVPDGDSYLHRQANYTCTAVETDPNTHAVTSATWKPDTAPLLWLSNDAPHTFAAISPAIELTPVTHNTDGTEMAIPAATFTLPSTYTRETLNYWSSLRSTAQGYSTKPTADATKLEMRQALTLITLIDPGFANVILTDIPQTAFVNPLTGEITAMRNSITQSSSTEGAPTYTLGGEVTGSKQVRAYTSAQTGVAYQTLAIPTSYYSNASAKHDGSGNFRYLTASGIYDVSISSGTDDNGTLTGGGFCPGSKLEVRSPDTPEDVKVLYSNGSYEEGNTIGSILNQICDNDGDVFPYLFILGPLHPECRAEIARGVRRMNPDIVYMEQLEEVEEGWFKSTDQKGAVFFLPQVTSIGKEAFACEKTEEDEEKILSIFTPLLKTIGKDAFKGNNTLLYLRGTDENGNFFIPAYTYAEGEVGIAQALYLTGLPEDYFSGLPTNPNEDTSGQSAVRKQLQLCMELIGTTDKETIIPGALDGVIFPE